MAYGFAIPEARDGIFTALALRSGLSGVTLSKNPPKQPSDLKSSSAFEAIFTGRIDGQSYQGLAEVPFMTAGASAFSGQFTMWLTVQVMKVTTSDTEETCSERAWTLASEIIGLAATQGGACGVSTSATLKKFWVDGFEFDENTARLDRGGAVCSLSIGLRCNAEMLIS